MTTAPAVQDHYPEGAAHCYGCGRMNEAGLHLRSSWEGDEVVARFRPRPEHIAFPGFVYGGLLASLIDCHGMATAAATAERAAGREVGAAPAPRFVTAALRVDFLAPTPLGTELVLRARVAETGRRKMVVRVSVRSGSSETARGEVIAVPMPEAMGAKPR